MIAAPLSRLLASGALAWIVLSQVAVALPDSITGPVFRHGIAMRGEPALTSDLTALPQVDPDAPKGGRISMGEVGGFDSLNPYTTMGRAPAWLGTLSVESLMMRAWDEPFTLYGLLADGIATDEERSWVEFSLHPDARFADGSPVTIDDVIWSFDALAKAHPRYHAAHARVAQVRQTGPRSVRFDFKAPDRELPLLIGLRPILSRKDWQDRDIGRSGMTPPLGSGPYQVADVDPGRSITLRKRPDWWAADLPVMRGMHNLDEIRIEYFADASVMFEAFKAGQLSVFREHQSNRWLHGYDFQRATSGQIERAEIPHQRPALMTGLVFNLRNPDFADWRVRQALIDSFNFGFINNALTGGQEPRVQSWFANSPLAMPPGAASPEVATLLAPFAAQLPPDALADLSLSPGRMSEADRPALMRASQLLDEAGWTVQDGKRVDGKGRQLTFTVSLPMGAAELRSAVTIWGRSLQRLGIAMKLATLDDAQLTARLKDYDFDVTSILRANSLSPGAEQVLYWGSRGRDVPGTRNIAGLASPAADAMIARLTEAVTPEDFTTAVQALDRVLMAERLVIPMWFPDRARLAHDRRLRFAADRLPIYGDGAGFLPEIWWWDDSAQ